MNDAYLKALIFRGRSDQLPHANTLVSFKSSTQGVAVALWIAFVLEPASAVENSTTPNFQTTVPTQVQGLNWMSGWGATGITGWDYVGQTDGGPGGVYLGNGWVITAGHVGLSNLTLGGVRYLAVGNSNIGITSNGAPVDLCLFRLQTHPDPDLPALFIRSQDPQAFISPGPGLDTATTGSPVVMIGYGGGKSWGCDTVTHTNYPISLSSNQNYTSTDFITYLGTFTNSYRTITNNAYLISGDSGGGGFIYNSALSRWELAGINEAVGPYPGPTQYSAFVQLNTYASQINGIVNPPPDGPTVPLPGLVFMACLLFLVASRSIDTHFRSDGKK